MDRVTANVIERMYEIESAAGSGAAFTIDFAGRQHLVTAKHLLPPGDPAPDVKVSNRFGSNDLRLGLLDVEPESADVAVAQLDQPLVDDLRLDPTMDGMHGRSRSSSSAIRTGSQPNSPPASRLPGSRSSRGRSSLRQRPSMTFG
jgi:hypothetical protein